MLKNGLFLVVVILNIALQVRTVVVMKRGGSCVYSVNGINHCVHVCSLLSSHVSSYVSQLILLLILVLISSSLYWILL